MPVFNPVIHCHLRQYQLRGGQRPKNMIGREFNRLTPFGFLGMVNNRSHWLLRCDCGTFWVADIGALQRGYTKSCGCLNQELRIARNTTHGQSKTRTYHIWSQMISRCHYPNNEVFHHYGGRGIVVCDRWINSFANFLADMGHPPTTKHTIDRTNNNEGYGPGNCTWVTMATQSQNKRTNRRITANGETHILMNWARIRGMTRESIASRLKRGWTPEEALELVQRTDRRTKAYRALTANPLESMG